MIFSYPNVWNTCLLILRQRGYRLFLLGPDEFTSLSDCTWNAEKDGMKLRAKNPIELIGLASIYEHHQPKTVDAYWWRVEGPDLVNELEMDWKRTLSRD